MLLCRLVCLELCPKLIPRQPKVCAAPPHLPHKLPQLLLQLHLLRLKLLPPRNPATLTQRPTAPTRMLAHSAAQLERQGMSHWLAAQRYMLVPAMAHTWDRLMMMTTVVGSRRQHTTSLPSPATSLSFPYRIPAGLKPWLSHTCLRLLSWAQGHMLLGSAGKQAAATVLLSVTVAAMGRHQLGYLWCSSGAKFRAGLQGFQQHPVLAVPHMGPTWPGLALTEVINPAGDCMQ